MRRASTISPTARCTSQSRFDVFRGNEGDSDCNELGFSDTISRQMRQLTHE
jgi:hypothetical protein